MTAVIGRTARIGNHGLATSFYNDRNSSIAPDLVKILMENNQDVPDFLEEYKPTGELNFDENDDSEELPFTAGAAADGGAWGTEGAGQDQDLSW